MMNPYGRGNRHEPNAVLGLCEVLRGLQLVGKFQTCSRMGDGENNERNKGC